MTIVLITGDHPRHKYVVNQLVYAGLVNGWIIEKRKPFFPEAPIGLGGDLTYLFNMHFKRREEAEERFFGTQKIPGGLRILEVSPQTLNSPDTGEFIKECAPRLVLSYGCHKLSDDLISSSKSSFWNTHGGLSPQYRGVTTHFWPSYMLEPQMTGMTMHETTSHIDGGAIIHQTAALNLCATDGLHDLAARTVKAYADEIPLLLKVALDGELPHGKPQKASGKIWLESDWRPEHLKLIYNVWEDRISAAVLNGDIAGRIPNCISVLRRS